MFKQITSLNGNEWYLISSLWMFIIFFITVAILLIKMKKQHMDYMRHLPLEDEPEIPEELTEKN